MKNLGLVALAAFVVIVGAASGSHAQQAARGPMMQPGEGGPPPGRADVRDPRGWRGGHAHGPMLAMMMAMMDTDGDQTLTLAEVQAVHARLFKYADQNSDGKLTAQEITTFVETGGLETGR